MAKIKIKTIEDARPYAGQRVKLFFKNEPRGEGVLKLGTVQHIGVGDSGPEGVGWPASDALALSLYSSDCFLEVCEPSAGLPIEIRSEDDARKWVGRRVFLNRVYLHGGFSCCDEGVFQYTIDLQGDVEMFVGDGGVGLRAWCGPRAGQYGSIELLDGPAHPRPDGDGWVWVQTAVDAVAQFRGKTCEVDAPARARSMLGPRREVIENLHMLDDGDDDAIDGDQQREMVIDYRGGVWIREVSQANTADPTPEPPPLQPPTPEPATEWPLSGVQSMRNIPHDLDVGDLITLTMDDGTREVRRVVRRTQSLTERLAELQAASAAAARAVDELAAQIARESDDARFPLPDGYTWDACGDVVAADGSCAFIDEDEVNFDEPVPVDVIRALIARYDAEHLAEPAPYSVDLNEGDWMSDHSHEFAEGDLVRLTHENGETTDHEVIDSDKDGDLWVTPRYVTKHGVTSALVGRGLDNGHGVTKITRL